MIALCGQQLSLLAAACDVSEDIVTRFKPYGLDRALFGR
jgi:hypothetical protein